MRLRLLATIVIGSLVAACDKSSPTAPSTTSVTGVASVSGAVALVTAPSDARLDALQSDTTTRLFNEVLGVTLAAPLTVDFATPGFFTNDPSLPLPTIAAGTVVNSYYVVADPVNAPAGGIVFAGTITFDRNVLGVITLNNEFAISNAILGRPGTQYSAAGIQLDFAQLDTLSLSADRRTVSFVLRVDAAADNLRIVTER